jgi:uncharacterized protein (TIGR03437 family)
MEIARGVMDAEGKMSAPSDVPRFAQVRYRSVYPGVDFVIYGNQGNVEYDWVAAPGADPASIRFALHGQSAMRVDQNGDLVLAIPGGEVRHGRPSIYQLVKGARQPVTGGFIMEPGGGVRFQVGRYDRRLPLVIDPAITFASAFGGGGCTTISPPIQHFDDFGSAVALDGAGNIYVAGITYSSNFPLVGNLGPASVPLQGLNCASGASFVAKLSPDGKTLLYSTLLSAGLSPPSIAVDTAGNVYVTGATSGDIPRLGGAATQTAGGLDAFVVKLDPNGHLLASVLLGGANDDVGTSIALASDGSLYVAGNTQSADFPTTPGAFRPSPVGSPDAFLVKLNAATLSGNQLPPGAVIYATYLGPSYAPAAYPGGPLVPFLAAGGPFVTADGSGNAFVAASAPESAPAWGATPVASHATCSATPCTNLVLAKVNPTGAQLLYAAYFGGSGTDWVYGLAIDASGNAYVSGLTTSTDLPTTSGALQTTWTPSGYSTGFVAKFSSDAGKPVYATYLGGSSSAYGIAVDSAGNAYVGGVSGSNDFPIRSGIQVSLEYVVCNIYGMSGTLHGQTYCASAGTLAVLNPAGSQVVWSTYLGSNAVRAIALDPSGNVWATGTDIVLTAVSSASPQTYGVGLVKIAPQETPLQFFWDSLTNAASFYPGLPKSGGLASLFVQGLNLPQNLAPTTSQLPTELGGVTIVVDGVLAPILSITNLGTLWGAAAQQINFQVPFEAADAPVSAGPPNVVEVRYGGMSTYLAPPTVGPGIFVLPDGSPAVQHASDYSLVSASNPVVAGETIIVYATGLGPVTSGPPSGAPATGPAAVTPCFTPTVSFGSVVYAGLAPGYVGLYQLNVVMSQTLTSGGIEIQITDYGCLDAQYFETNYYTSNTVTLPVR